MGKVVEALMKEVVGEEVFKNIQKEKRYKIELWSAWEYTKFVSSPTFLIQKFTN